GHVGNRQRHARHLLRVRRLAAGKWRLAEEDGKQSRPHCVTSCSRAPQLLQKRASGSLTVPHAQVPAAAAGTTGAALTAAGAGAGAGTGAAAFAPSRCSSSFSITAR